MICSIPEIPDLMAAAGLPRLTPARIRQIAKDDDAFPETIWERGRVRLWLWAEVECFFRERKLTPGARTDLHERRQGDDAKK
ncbi:hypothetical protein [Streptomyces boncukensis]|uniref:AlpA family phage regulatory protein n=1 Tax=Streptomyces boncukensis TaxID=2711219 RepID=A0A6G4WRM8_9ACTN|nr:hypothetical protein [Streptomyces boncukensis]NGO67855.1 hypothetical protein [Streptomyces boncukensis]